MKEYGVAGRAAGWHKQCMVEAVKAMIEPVPVEAEVTIGRTWGR